MFWLMATLTIQLVALAGHWLSSKARGWKSIENEADTAVKKKRAFSSQFKMIRRKNSGVSEKFLKFFINRLCET